MRDLATFEANTCDHLAVQSRFTAAQERVSQCLQMLTGHSSELDRFSDRLYRNVEGGVG